MNTEFNIVVDHETRIAFRNANPDFVKVEDQFAADVGFPLRTADSFFLTLNELYGCVLRYKSTYYFPNQESYDHFMMKML